MMQKNTNPPKKNFPFEEEIRSRFKKWTGISDVDVDDALKDLSGDTYFEMRKLISQELSAIETLIASGKYCGYKDGEKLNDEDRKNINAVKEDLKEYCRIMIETTWRSILNKQKVGIDKLGLAIRPYLKHAEDNGESI